METNRKLHTIATTDDPFRYLRHELGLAGIQTDQKWNAFDYVKLIRSLRKDRDNLKAVLRLLIDAIQGMRQPQKIGLLDSCWCPLSRDMRIPGHLPSCQTIQIVLARAKEQKLLQ